MTIARFAGAAALTATLALLLPSLAYAGTDKAGQTGGPVLTCKVKAADGLTYSVIKPGKGEKPQAGSRVEVNYVGRLRANGTEFDSGKATKFKVAEVIPGFAQGLQLMQPGGSYRLCIPAALGYGEQAAGSIPPNSDLVFEVDLLSFSTPPPKPVIPAAERGCAQTTASGLGYSLVTAGNGRNPTDADMALVDFSIFDAQTGVVEQQREWEKIPLAQATAIFGEALRLMQVGSTYRFCMPKAAEAEAALAPSPNIIVKLLDLRPAPVADE